MRQEPAPGPRRSRLQRQVRTLIARWSYSLGPKRSATTWDSITSSAPHRTNARAKDPGRWRQHARHALNAGHGVIMRMEPSQQASGCAHPLSASPRSSRQRRPPFNGAGRSRTGLWGQGTHQPDWVFTSNTGLGPQQRNFLVRICTHIPFSVHYTRTIDRSEGSRALSTCRAPSPITLHGSPQGVSDVTARW